MSEGLNAMIQAIADQEVSELSDEMVRLLALKDGVIAKLKEQRDRARRQRIQMDAKSADFEKEAKRYRGELEVANAEIATLTEQRDEARAAYAALRDQYGELLNATCGECDVLTERRDRAIAERNETRDRTYETIRQLRDQRGRAMKVLRHIASGECMSHGYRQTAQDFLDAEAAAETAPSLPETPEA